MKPPLATYRLQFRGGMDFAAAAEIVPYFKELGVSHLYASPVFAATKGSSHGYDVTDHNEIDPVLGGREGFDRLCDRLHTAGIGLILDIVPNHMAASVENPWWRDVIEWGAQSRFAGHFDIEWSRKLTLPILGRPFEETLAANELSLVLDGEVGSLAMAYFDNHVPLHPASWDQVLAKIDHPVATLLADAASRCDPDRPQGLHDRVREAGAGEGDIAEELKALSRDLSFIATLYAEQPWQLVHWKEARRTLSYRRFFEITGLVGVRVEDRQVFEDVHRLTLQLVRSGQVDGLRIDHVDGLADPASYLRMLREAVGPDTYLVVEKILAPDETLPADWPVEGTTGYEFIDAMVDLLADADGLRSLSATYQETTGAPLVEVARRQAKREIVTVNFEGELRRLAEAVTAIAGGRFELDEIHAGLVALIVAMPVYRTYVGEAGASDADRAALARAKAEAQAQQPEISGDVLDFIIGLFLGDTPATAEIRRARTLFQQLSSPAMAKGVEDTLFYRDHRLLVLNEVGCEPERPPPSLERFHAFMKERQTSNPLSLSATSTHDTKRGEDARARLLALTEAPELWAACVARWRAMNRDLVRDLAGLAAPEPEVEWMIYQALMAAWPDELDPADGDGVEALRSRLLTFLEKAVREAKLRTSWTAIEETYEAAIRAYSEGLLEPASRFLAEFVRETAPFRKAGQWNALVQTLVKLTAPGIPDIYQGSESGDFSFVDPDNRRSVDFDRLRDLLQAAGSPVSFPEWKARILSTGLAVRGVYSDLFNEGDYLALDVIGTHCMHLAAFARIRKESAAIVVVPRLVLDLGEGNSWHANHWDDTRLCLPGSLAGRRYRESFSGRTLEASTSIPAGEILARTPCALLLVE